MTELEHDYFKSGLTIKEIAEKHNLSREMVSYLKSKYKEPEPPKIVNRVLIFDEIDQLRIEALLKEFNISYEMPFQGVEIKITSKL